MPHVPVPTHSILKDKACCAASERRPFRQSDANVGASPGVTASADSNASSSAASSELDGISREPSAPILCPNVPSGTAPASLPVACTERCLSSEANRGGMKVERLSGSRDPAVNGCDRRRTAAAAAATCVPGCVMVSGSGKCTSQPGLNAGRCSTSSVSGPTRYSRRHCREHVTFLAEGVKHTSLTQHEQVETRKRKSGSKQVQTAKGNKPNGHDNSKAPKAGQD